MAWELVGSFAPSAAAVEAMVAERVKTAIESLTPSDVLRPIVAAEVVRAVGAMPPARDGLGLSGGLIDRDGHLVLTLSDGTTKNVGVVVGQQGPKGDPGESTVGPQGPAGAKGDPGQSIKGEKGDPGLNGSDGKDGVGLRGEKGDTGDPGKSVKGEKGDPGSNGANGRDAIAFGLDDWRGFAFDPETRQFSMTFAQGDRTKTLSCYGGEVMFYRDVFVEGKTYEPGDVVTWAGAMWYAREQTSAKPGLSTTESRAWKLCVKAGRDGKVGPTGPVGPLGPRGDKGDRGPDRW